jgi:four helix bundle protein
MCDRVGQTVKRFYGVSWRSTNETKYWLVLLADTGLINKEAVNVLLSEVNQMLATSVLKLKSRNF